MRQVPVGIIGRGRVARHFSFYFDHLKVPFVQWHRNSEPGLRERLESADPLLILIKDSEIEKFILGNPWLRNKRLIHFSGTLVTSLAHGFHPLMTFGESLYAPEEYKKIPFVIEEGGPSFKEIFPELENPAFAIKPSEKSFYHALCVLSGNFTTILWNKFFMELEGRLGIPREAAFPYLERVAENLKADSARALTGPLQRRDEVTIRKNLEALKNDPFQKIYEAFYETSRDDTRGGP